jgi:hypothetical protein
MKAIVFQNRPARRLLRGNHACYIRTEHSYFASGIVFIGR